MNTSCLMMKKHQTSYSIPPVALNARYQLICSKHKAPNLTFYSSKTCIFVHFVHMFQLLLSFCTLFFLQHIPKCYQKHFQLIIFPDMCIYYLECAIGSSHILELVYVLTGINSFLPSIWNPSGVLNFHIP